MSQAELKALPTFNTLVKGSLKIGNQIPLFTPKQKQYSWKGQGLLFMVTINFSVVYLYVY